jgi:hypothetical protein
MQTIWRMLLWCRCEPTTTTTLEEATRQTIHSVFLTEWKRCLLLDRLTAGMMNAQEQVSSGPDAIPWCAETLDPCSPHLTWDVT